jgi:hypothetical protein
VLVLELQWELEFLLVLELQWELELVLAVANRDPHLEQFLMGILHYLPHTYLIPNDFLMGR